MKRTGSTSLLLAALAASSLFGSTHADPLHAFGNEGAWVHVDSGWQYPKDVDGFARVGQPYNMDGNNDAGAEYRQASGQLLAEVEIYAADSAATAASLDGAKAAAAGKAGEAARAASEKPFAIESLQDASGVKVRYVVKGRSAGAQTNLYFFTTDRWRIKVVASAADGGKDGDRALDAFVRALPWRTLGTDSGLH